jgi:feruloyl esterase
MSTKTSYAWHSLQQVIDANDPDLSAFRQHGGKLIMYFGWADPQLTQVRHETCRKSAEAFRISSSNSAYSV